jgi:hypothetical protein
MPIAIATGRHRHGMEAEELRGDLTALADMARRSPRKKKRPFDSIETTGQQLDELLWPAPLKIATPVRSLQRRTSLGAAAVVYPAKNGGSLDRNSAVGRIPVVSSAAGVGASEPPRSTDERGLEAATKAALGIFDRFWVEFLRNREKFGSKGASRLAEQQAEDEYRELCDAVVGVLPYTKHTEAVAAGDGNYDVVEFHGCTPPRLRMHGKQDWAKKFVEQIAYNRNSTEQGRARDALCAALSALASRGEHIWLEAQDDMEWKLDELENSEKFADRAQAFEAVLKDMASRNVRGFFSHALVKSSSVYRLSFGREGPQRSLPASLIITYSLPLSEAFEHMDDGGPLPDMTSSWVSSREFALQEINKGAEPGSREERLPVERLRPEPQIRQLLLNRQTQVVMLDAIAALAPRRLARENGIGDIVRAELVGLLSRCKAEGKAVVFMCGGDDPHILAEKVYLREPFTKFGLRCGNLRWRSSADEPWAREKPWCQRVCLGLQLP